MTKSELFSGMDAALIDMDGTLLDTMQVWRQCNVDYIAKCGVKLTPAEEQELVNCSTGVLLFEYAREHFGLEMDRDSFRQLQVERISAEYAGNPRVKPGAREFLEALRDSGAKVVLATATWSKQTVMGLTRSGLVRMFDAICCSDSVGIAKSKPEYFDRVSEIVGVPKERMVLFDDAIYAHRMVRAVGLRGGVAVTDPTNELFRKEFAETADIIVDSLAELLPLPVVR